MTAPNPLQSLADYSRVVAEWLDRFTQPNLPLLIREVGELMDA